MLEHKVCCSGGKMNNMHANHEIGTQFKWNRLIRCCWQWLAFVCLTQGDMTLSNIKVYSCEPGQEYVFDMTQDYEGTGRTGRPCHRCQVCESAQPSKESLRKHFITSHICYRYLSHQDQNCYQVVAEKQELRIQARMSLKSKGQPAPKCEVSLHNDQSDARFSLTWEICTGDRWMCGWWLDEYNESLM